MKGELELEVIMTDPKRHKSTTRWGIHAGGMARWHPREAKAQDLL
jgi:hypothetical protein